MSMNWPLPTARPSYPLVNPTEPNLMREQFPYTTPPRVLFDGVQVPVAPAPEIFITDTTFRDGQQARTPYTVQQIVDLYKLLSRLSGPNGVIRQSEFFLYSEKDRAAVRQVQELGLKFPEVTAWIRAVKKDFELVKSMEIKETGILTSCSDYHIYLKLGMDRRQAMEQYLDVVRAALEHGVRPRCHLEDITRADIYGFVVPFAQALMQLMDESGIPVKLRLCDTMGYGVPYPGAMLPRSVPRLVHALRHEAGVPSHLLEWHGHNDFYKVLINGATAWLHGCASVNGTVLGFGERTGNTPIEGLIFEYLGLTGDDSVDTTVITEIAEYMQRECGYVLPPMTPFAGKQFNVTAAGIHADGLIKNEEIYNIFDTTALLKRPLGVNVTDKAGVAGVAFWVNQQLGLVGDARLEKRHPGVQAMAHWVLEQYKDGRTTSLSEEEIRGAARLYLPEYFKDREPGARQQPCLPGAPVVGVAAVVARAGHVLLERRAIEGPGYGLWALPGGMVDGGEVLEEAMAREVLEETGIAVRVGRLLSAQGGQRVCILFYECEAVSGDLRGSWESLEVAWVLIADIPWDAFAFPRHAQALRTWLAGGDVTPNSEGS